MKITRRLITFLIVLAVPLALFSAGQSSKPTAKNQYLAFVGTYTTKTNSKGIYAFDFDPATGKLTLKGVAAETSNPSWVVIHPGGKYAYAANESGKQSTITAFAIDAKSARLTQLNQLSALGEDPCYLSFDKTGKYVFVANYTSGNVVVFPISADGKLGAVTANVRDEGSLGPNKERQDGPHAHWIEVMGRNHFVFVADLGLDRLLIYNFDATNGSLKPGKWPSSFDLRAAAIDTFSTKLNPGAGPRHAAFGSADNFVYVLSELNSTVTVFTYNERERYHPIQSLSTLPVGFAGRNDAAEIAIHPNGKFLYASNRGHDSIAVFAIDGASRKLTSKGYVPTGGKEPRHFAIDPTGNYLFAENQLSDTIVTFRIDPATGQLTATGDSVSVPSPVDLVFLPQD